MQGVLELLKCVGEEKEVNPQYNMMNRKYHGISPVKLAAQNIRVMR